MKQTWTMEELDYLEDMEVREDCLEAMRRVAYIKFENFKWICNSERWLW